MTKELLDWMRTPEAAANGYDEARIKLNEKLWRRQEALVARIRSAFSGVVLGDGIGLFEGDAIDDMGNDESMQRKAREKDERHSWESLKEDDLSRRSYALCFTDAAGFRFLIPAFMLAELNCSVSDPTVINLSGIRDDPYKRYSKLNSIQVETIIDFLRLFRDDPDEQIFHADIETALEEFWKPRWLEQNGAERGAAPNP